jgi:glycerophosphoryl diester phosphodiesterase
MWKYDEPVRVAAHRGDRAYYPENTLPAFESALKYPIDQIEMDLHMTKDGELVLMHDPRLDRCTDGSGLIREHTLAEIKKLDAGGWKDSRFTGTRVPTFQEFLELMQDYPDVGLNVELKDYPEPDVQWARESTDKAIALLQRYGISGRAMINSWSAEILEYVDEKYHLEFPLHGYYPYSNLRGRRTRDPFDYVYCACFYGGEQKPVLEKSAFEAALSRGVEPWVFFPDDSLVHCAEAIANGAKMITANDPQKVLAFLREQGLHR